MARFRVRQPSNALVRTSYQPGAVMAGLTTKIEVELMASVPCVIGATAPHRDALVVQEAIWGVAGVGGQGFEDGAAV